MNKSIEACKAMESNGLVGDIQRQPLLDMAVSTNHTLNDMERAIEEIVAVLFGEEMPDGPKGEEDREPNIEGQVGQVKYKAERTHEMLEGILNRLRN